MNRPIHRRTAAHVARRFVCALALAAIVSAPSFAQQRTFTPTDESPEDLPAGTGRDETFYLCTPCHGFKIVSQQGMTRPQWEDSLNWMTSKHGMNPIEGDDRKLVLDYLEQHYPPTARAGGGRDSPNPFLK